MSLCLPCPICAAQLFFVEEGAVVVIRCHRCGPLAQGNSLNQAIRHANIFAQGLITKDPEAILNLAVDNVQKVILKAKLGIDPKEGK